MENKEALKGINFKQIHSGKIFTGIHLPTFIEHASLFTNPDGWINFTITTLSTPHSKGYTHKAVIKKAECQQGDQQNSTAQKNCSLQ